MIRRAWQYLGDSTVMRVEEGGIKSLSWSHRTSTEYCKHPLLPPPPNISIRHSSISFQYVHQ